MCSHLTGTSWRPMSSRPSWRAFYFSELKDTTSSSPRCSGLVRTSTSSWTGAQVAVVFLKATLGSCRSRRLQTDQVCRKFRSRWTASWNNATPSCERGGRQKHRNAIQRRLPVHARHDASAPHQRTPRSALTLQPRTGRGRKKKKSGHHTSPHYKQPHPRSCSSDKTQTTRHTKKLRKRGGRARGCAGGNV